MKCHNKGCFFLRVITLRKVNRVRDFLLRIFKVILLVSDLTDTELNLFGFFLTMTVGAQQHSNKQYN